MPRRRNAMLLLAAALFLYVVYARGGIPCPIKLVTGIPCPSCGIGRALVAVIQGDLPMGFRWHPLWPLALALSILYFLQGSERFPGLSALWRRRGLWVAALVLLLGVYLLRMAFLFPTVPPMDFQKSALFPRICSQFHP